MSVRTKLTGFVVVLLVTFGAAFAVGDLVGPIGEAETEPSPAHQQDGTSQDGEQQHGDGHGEQQGEDR